MVHPLSNLLGSAPEVEYSDEDIPDIFPDRYARVKAALKQGKAAGPDDIPPEVLKNCDLDVIVLEMCNTALMENQKPDHNGT